MEPELIKSNYRIFSWISAILLTLSGLVYSAVQIVIFGKISDTLFICLTIFESLFVLYAGDLIFKYIISNRTKFSYSAVAQSDPKENDKVYLRLIGIFGNFKRVITVIFIWAFIMGVLPIVQRYWRESFTLSLFYGIFLFFTNIITAYFFILLISFYRISLKLWDVIHVELWKRENASATIIFSLSKKIAFVAAIYMTSSLTAWITSPKVPFGGEIVVFIAFSIVILIGSIILPSLPYVNKMANLKQEALINIDCEIQKEYMSMVQNIQDINNRTILDKISLLIEMRSRIESIQVFPFRLKTITASLSIIFISILPVILEYFIKLFIG